MKTLLAILLFALPAHAATYYVGKNGSDNNTCTQAQNGALAKLTIQAGVACLVPGDTLYVGEGTYVEVLNYQAYAIPSGTSASPILIAAYPGHLVTLFQPAGAYPQMSTVEFGTGMGNVTVRGFVLDADDRGAQVVKVQLGATNIRIESCEIKNGNNNGVLWGGDNGAVVNCNIHHNGMSGAGYGIYASGASNVYEGNEIHHNSSYGLHVYGNYPGNRDSIFRNNRIHDNGVNQCAIGVLIGGENHWVYNNTIWNENGGAVQVGYTGPTNIKVDHNTIYNVGNACGGGGVQSGVYIGQDASGTRVRNNLIDTTPTPVLNDGSGSTISNNVSAGSPSQHWVDVANGDFHLAATSPAINAGALGVGITTDADGNSRLDPPDAGAFEFGGTAPPPPPPPPPDPCVANPLVVSVVRWPSSQTGRRLLEWQSGTHAIATFEFTWPGTVTFTRTDGCQATVTK